MLIMGVSKTRIGALWKENEPGVKIKQVVQEMTSVVQELPADQIAKNIKGKRTIRKKGLRQTWPGGTIYRQLKKSGSTI